ncbi:MAG: FAD-binding protein [Ruthenibacterium sp.]
MQLTKQNACDVFVAGAGIAGILAAITAAENGKSVILASSAAIFSGSSFYPGTWGLGLVGPENAADEEDLVQTILSVGCGMADETMVRTFVGGITPAIARVKAMGVKLKQAQAQNQKDFIPCFDHKHRAWNGILADSARAVLKERMDALHILQMPNCALLDITETENRVTGVLVKTAQNTLAWLGCKALVLATGGYGGLFERRLTTNDVGGMGQFLALQHGCKLVNMEFMQMMPGCLAPCANVIFNEKTFRYATLHDADDADILANSSDKTALLTQRGAHGPFTSRLDSKAVDFAITQAKGAEKQGVKVTYSEEMQRNMPEFIKTYFDWLWQQKHLTAADSVQIALFAHAANGGVQIAPDTSTPCGGLFACGEVTGGMHGADRIGGLSTANGLVFGQKAGKAAAEYSASAPKNTADTTREFAVWELADAAQIRAAMRKIMSHSAMAVRDAASLQSAAESIAALQKQCVRQPTADMQKAADARLLEAQLTLAICILKAENLRCESRGSHYRADYPTQNTAYNQRILVQKQGEILCIEREKQ